MSTSLLVIAESGSGKSTSIENLKPEETFIINVANKALPFKSSKKNYPIFHPKDHPKGRLYEQSNADEIVRCMAYISAKRPEIKNLVIDDFQYVSAFEFFDRSAEVGYTKFTDIGNNVRKIAQQSVKLREDLIVFILTHVEESTDLEGRRKLKAKTIGKLVDEKLTLEGLFPIVLFGKVKKDKDSEEKNAVKFVFETQNNGENTCKSPKGMFPEFEIPNDLAIVRKAITDYYEN